MYQEMNLSDIEALIKRQAKVDVQIQQQAANQVLVHYLLVNMDVQLIGVSDDALLFRYQLGKLAGFMAKGAAKGAAKMLGKNIRTKKINWDTEQQQIRLNLAVFAQFRPWFQQHRLASAVIEEGKIKLQFVAK